VPPTTLLMGPRISSTLPICVLFCRKMGALKYGIYGGRARARRPSERRAMVDKCMCES
jgi:hypothetical protein